MHRGADDLEVDLLLDLYDAGWKGPDNSWPNLRQIIMSSIATSFVKKFHNDEVLPSCDEKALALFKECNERCRNFGGVIPSRLDEEYVIGEMKVLLYDFFNPCFVAKAGVDYSEFREPLLLNLSDIAKHFGLGNGSNIGAKSTDMYSKLVTSTMCHTDQSLPFLFKQAISTDKLWSDVEAFRSKNYGSELVKGSRLSFVPKSRVISRTICTEPVLNMLFQKGIGGIIERRLRQVFSIDLSTQPRYNARLAQVGSVSGQFGTIDLSSASDTISITMLKEVLPAEALKWLMLTRSPATTLPGGEVLDLHMISSMGNGFTFPLQTLIFACLVRAAYKIYGIKFVRSDSELNLTGNFAVFGDDIIVDRRVYSVVCRCLTLLGFSVNSDKSFNEGLFRESCGHDYFNGYDVRGVYIKTLRDVSDRYSAINRLLRWSAKHGILLHRVICSLRKGLKFLFVPFDESDDAGIKVPRSLVLRPRFDHNGAIFYMASVLITRKFAVPSDDRGRASAYTRALGKPWNELPGFSYSPDGIMLCLLAGWLRGGFLGLRTVRRKAVLRRRVCPDWDSRITATGVSQSFADSWKAVCELSLVS